MNGHDVINRVIRQFGDESGVQITTIDIIRWINDAQKEIAYQNDLLQAVGTMSSVLGTSEYTFPTDMLSMRSMYYKNKKLRFMSRQEFDEYIISTDPDMTQNGDPLVYTRWANQFILYPVPQTAETNGIRLYYTRRPVDVLSGDSAIDLPLEYHNRVVEYCLQQAYETDEDWNAAGIKNEQFNTGLDTLKQQETFSDREFYPLITIREEDM